MFTFGECVPWQAIKYATIPFSSASLFSSGKQKHILLTKKAERERVPLGQLAAPVWAVNLAPDDRTALFKMGKH